MSEPIITVENLGKRYRLGGGTGGGRGRDGINHYRTLRESLSEGARQLFTRRPAPGAVAAEDEQDFWALRDVSFTVQPGEVVGIIGRNGAGKSTLLKVLSRITEPTEGRIKIKGRVASLLEVGTGFHPELTGRENIYLNGAVLGMTRAEIKAKFEEIVAFAEVERFLDTPVKRYSSGMYVRLAFAVAAHLEPEILIVDEVLAVGDAEFQKKCLGKMESVAKGEGRTVLIVSHNLAVISTLCDAGVLLENGKSISAGRASFVVNQYLKTGSPSNGGVFIRRGGTGETQVESIKPDKAIFLPSENKKFRYRLTCKSGAAGKAWISIHVRNNKHDLLLQCDSRVQGFWLSKSEKLAGTFEFSTPWLKPGDYYLEVFISEPQVLLDHVEHCSTFAVSEELPYAHATSSCGVEKGFVFADFNFGVED